MPQRYLDSVTYLAITYPVKGPSWATLRGYYLTG